MYYISVPVLGKVVGSRGSGGRVVISHVFRLTRFILTILGTLVPYYKTTSPTSS